VHKMSGPIECTSMFTRIAMTLGCPEMANLACIEGMYLFLVLTILFMRTSCARNPIILYLCCMAIRRSSYLTRAFNCTLVKVLHYSLIEWRRTPPLRRTTSHSRASSYGGSTADNDYTTCSPSGAPVGH
jgi:hypothetical protein